MNREELITKITVKIKLIRVEHGFSQDKMADILGISKKTLIQIEKERVEASWSTIISVIALFTESEILQNILGNEPLEVLNLVAFEKVDRRLPRTMGGIIWWKDIQTKNGYTIQQNYISQHYRIIDSERYNWFSTFEEEEVFIRWNELTED